MRLTHPVSKRTRSDTHVHLNPSKLVPAPDKLVTFLHASPSHGPHINTPSVVQSKLFPLKTGIKLEVAIKVFYYYFISLEGRLWESVGEGDRKRIR